MKWIALDGGTTNTRLRLMEADTLLAEEKRPVGAGDTARTGSNAQLKAAVRDGLRALLGSGAGAERDAEVIVASGMIGSELGLYTIPHLRAPAGAAELAAAGELVQLPEITPIPFFFIPGVKNAADDRLDLMRGEETECLGLMAQLGITGSLTAMLPGTHNKLIRVRDGRITACYTAMSGEILSAIAEQTLLKNALPEKWPLAQRTELRAGCRDAQQYGMMHAMFHVRMMQTQLHTTPEQRFSYFLGAGLADDLKLLTCFAGVDPVVIAGSDPMKTAFADLIGAFCPNPVRLADSATASRSTVAGAYRIWLLRK